MSLTYYHGEIPQRIDSLSRKILVDIKDNSKTVLQISKDLELSISKTYRILNKLNKKSY